MPRALAAAADNGLLLAAPDVASDGRFDAGWAAAPLTSLLAIPVGGESAGLVLVGFRDRRIFTNDDLELAQQVAAAARGALERSRLFEAERTARALSQQLAHTGRLLATELDPAAVIDVIVG